LKLGRKSDSKNKDYRRILFNFCRAGTPADAIFAIAAKEEEIKKTGVMEFAIFLE